MLCFTLRYHAGESMIYSMNTMAVRGKSTQFVASEHVFIEVYLRPTETLNYFRQVMEKHLL